jgi:hypothetical protein
LTYYFGKNGGVGWKEFGYLVLGNVLGAGNGLVLNDGGLGFRLKLGKNLAKLKDGKRLFKWKGPLDRGTGATTLDMSIGWLAWGKLPSDPSKFAVEDWAQAGAASNMTRTAPPIQVPMRMVRPLTLLLMERAEKIASAETVSRSKSEETNFQEPNPRRSVRGSWFLGFDSSLTRVPSFLPARTCD